MRSLASTPEEYLAELPSDRRDDVAAVRDVIVRHLPEGYEEVVNWGMLTYQVPVTELPAPHNKEPLCYVSLAAQKNYNAIYLMSVYGSEVHEAKLRTAFKKAGKKLDMGKSCVRFRKAADLPLETIGELVASIPPAQWIAIYQKARQK